MITKSSIVPGMKEVKIRKNLIL